MLHQRSRRAESFPSKRVSRPSITWSAVAALVMALAWAVTLAHGEGGAAALDVVGYCLAGLVAAATAVVVLQLLATAIDPPGSWVTLAFQYCVGLVPAMWVMLTLTSAVVGEVGEPPPPALVVIATIGVVTGIAAVAANAWRRWREASRGRTTLARTLAGTSRLNALLASAEGERFSGYRDVIRNQVSGPLASLQAAAGPTPNAMLADSIDAFQSGVMRPLAHLLHPVSVRVGLLPAVAALGRAFSVVAPSEIVERDAQGELLDKNVRLQVFRWVRHLAPSGSAVSIRLSTEDDHLLVSALGVRQARNLDPIQKVAGLTLTTGDEALTLSAPLRGAVERIQSEEAEAPQPLPRVPWNVWLLLTRPPVIDVRLVLLVGLVTMPFSFAILRNAEGTGRIITAILSVVVPVTLALPLTRVRVVPGTKRGTVTAIGLWLALGVAGGLMNVGIVNIVAPESVTELLIPVRVTGGVLRYSLIGLLILAARGLTAQAVSDSIALRVRLEAANADRAAVLAKADETDRFLSETLHRTVQGRLSAISLLLRLDRRQEAIAELNTLCRETLPGLEERLRSDAHASVGTHLPHSKTDHGLRIDDRVDWLLLERRAPWIIPALQRVIDECAVNARRHGGSRSMLVEITEASDRLTLRCEDDGRGLPARMTKGLGSKLFDEICADLEGEWSLSRRGGATCFALSLRVMEARDTGCDADCERSAKPG